MLQLTAAPFKAWQTYMRRVKCVQTLHHVHNFSTSQEPERRPTTTEGGKHTLRCSWRAGFLLSHGGLWRTNSPMTPSSKSAFFDWAVWTRRQLVFITFGSCEQTARSSVADRHFKAASVRKCVILCLWHDWICDCFPLLWQSGLNLAAPIVLSAHTQVLELSLAWFVAVI